jgi:C-terminal processing protease CtpA/Prc
MPVYFCVQFLTGGRAMKRAVPIVAILVWIAMPFCGGQQTQRVLSKDDQWKISEILRDARDEVKKHYYDPKLHGVDWDARFEKYSGLVRQAGDLGGGFRIVAAYLEELHDSHTYFVPPERMTRYEYGFRYALVGNDCFVTRIRPGTDAEAKLHVGDQVLLWNGFNLNREDFHDLRYYFNVLSPQVAVQLDVRSPGGETRKVVLKTIVKPGQRVADLTTSEGIYDIIRRAENEDHAIRSQVAERGDATIWKLPQFDGDFDEIRKNIAIARKHKALILDLRGNPGGAVETLKLVIGALFDHDVKIGDRVGKKETKPLTAKHWSDPFNGDLIVLIDAGSGSAAELLARVVQLEHRGKVIGDVSAGAVMEAQYHEDSRGTDTKFFYGFMVTDANLTMTDGKSLEKIGVVPDEQSLPTAADLAAGRDPVLAHAAEMEGVKLDAAEAGKLFKYEWLPI